MLLYQVKQALLALKQKPAFVGSVVSSMGLTLGVLLCVLSLAYALLIQPLPYPKQNQLFQASYLPLKPIIKQSVIRTLRS